MTLPAWIDLTALSALLQVVLIDITLAGDNAIVVGMAAAGLPQGQRGKAILLGILAATALRILFAVVTVQLLAVIGLTLAGGFLLLWVAWKMFREACGKGHCPSGDCGEPKSKTLAQALLQIVVADISMSLDNVLAVAGTAREHLWVLVAGLTLSVGLMGMASQLVARMIGRFPWIVWIGLGIITYVAFSMIWQGWHEVRPYMPMD
ncbi:membrane protein [Aliidongia dinghuensis]|uniref:Membrane protein n=1 Tax=Aliidongia dinghuensis TaxID=1867774 RepID=A0A8J3E5R7_9PROT|nr:TerC family protein [Aliidongia dinghuensis]GGF38038.1 membrane protein [Aliidongia dinghuensis]